MKLRYKVKLTSGQRNELLKLVKNGKGKAKTLTHARILLQADCSQEGKALHSKEIAKNLNIHERTVKRIRERYTMLGLEAAINRKPHETYKPRKLDGEQEAKLIALCCSQSPAGCKSWTLSLLADQLVQLNVVDSISRSTIHRTLKKRNNSQFPVVCMDESNKQHEKSKRENIPARVGKIERFDTCYEKDGISNIFLSFEPLTGKRWINIFKRRIRLDWAKHIQELVEKHYVQAEKIILVVDNLNIHCGAALYELLEPSHAKRIVDKLELHYTPKHASWLNMAEIELSHLSRQCLNRRFPDTEKVKHEVAAWVKARNRNCKIVNWQFTTNDARIKLKKLYPVIQPI